MMGVYVTKLAYINTLGKNELKDFLRKVTCSLHTGLQNYGEITRNWQKVDQATQSIQNTLFSICMPL